MHAHTDHTQAGSPAMVQAFAARNLQFLGLIENTIERLEGDTGHIRVIAAGIDKLLDEMQAEQSDAVLDPEGRLCELLHKTADMASRMYADAKRGHQSACGDQLLQPDDGVTDAYDEFLAALRELHDCVEEMREWIETHDALLEPSTGVAYSNVDDLIAALNAD